MLGKRSRPMQKIPSNSSSEMTPDHNSDSSSSSSCEKSSQAEGRTSFFDTPKIFIGFNPKSASDSEGAKSPTSPLDVKTFSGVGITHWQEIQLRSPREVLQCSSPRPWERRDSEGVGLGIVAALSNNEITATAGGAVHGSKLKILTGSSNQQGMFLAQQNYISSFSLSSPRPASLKLPYTLQSCSSSNAQPSSPIKISEPRKVTAANNDDDSSSYKFAEEASSPEGMEHSESYTCVITHGPESSIKHIYTGDDCTETVHFFVHSKEEKEILKSSEEEFKGCRNAFQYSMPDFLISCYLCKKPLNPNEDTYMYGGDKGFCSVECRYQQILIDEKSSSFHDSSPAETSAFPASYRSCAGHILSTGKRSPAA